MYIYLLAIFHIKSVYQVRFDYLFIELAAVIECEVRDLNPRSRAWEARTLTRLG